MQYLGQCCSCISHDQNSKHHSCKEGETSVPQVLSRIKGPWALIYWQVTLIGKFSVTKVSDDAQCLLETMISEVLPLLGIQNSSKTLWFGRDAFGRRSLLVHWPTPQDSRLLLASVSPLSSEFESSGILSLSFTVLPNIILQFKL